MVKRKVKTPRIRCFVGVVFPLYENIRPLLRDLESLGSEPGHDLRIAPLENLHVTLKFIGAVEQDQIALVDSILRSKSSTQHPVQLQCQRTGLFKNSLWIGVKENDYLKQVVAEIDEALTFLGIPSQTRRFVPHITLARFNSSLKQKATRLQHQYAETQWGEFTFDRYQLFKSDTLADGARYTILNEYLLSAWGPSG